MVVATPDHWHALATIWACQAGKHVYVEKPASHNLVEGRRMVEAARKYNRVVQTRHATAAAARVWPEPPNWSARASSAKFPSPAPGSPGRGQHRPEKDAAVPARCRLQSLARHPPRNGPSTPIVSITAGTGCGISAPASWATTAFTRWTGSAGCSTWTLPIVSSAGGGKLFYDDDQETPDTMTVTYDFPHCSVTWEHRVWSREKPREGTCAVRRTRHAGLGPEGRWHVENGIEAADKGTRSVAAMIGRRICGISSIASRILPGRMSAGPTPTSRKGTKAPACVTWAISPSAPATPFASTRRRKRA